LLDLRTFAALFFDRFLLRNAAKPVYTCVLRDPHIQAQLSFSAAVQPLRATLRQISVGSAQTDGRSLSRAGSKPAAINDATSLRGRMPRKIDQSVQIFKSPKQVRRFRFVISLHIRPIVRSSCDPALSGRTSCLNFIFVHMVATCRCARARADSFSCPMRARSSSALRLCCWPVSNATLFSLLENN
jgi:hypothetical protein